MAAAKEPTVWHPLPSRGREALLLAGILVLATALRLFHLGAQSFWIDEIFQIIDASAPWDHVLGGYLSFDLERTHKSPLSLVLHRLWLRLGDSEFHLRLPSVVFSLAEVGVLFGLARMLFGPLVALSAALLLAFSPLHIWYAQELRYYSLWTLVTTSSFLILVLAWRRSSVGRWAAYGISMVVGATSFILMAAIASLHWLSALLLARRPETPRPWLKGFVCVQAVFLAAAAPHLLRLGTDMTRVVGTPRDPELFAAPYTFFTFVAGFSAGPSLRDLHFSPGIADIILGHPELLLFFLVFAPLVSWGAWRVGRDAPARELLLPWAFGMPLMMLGVTYVLDNTYNVRYALPALTASTLVLAVGIVALRPARLRAAAVGAVALCIGYSLAQYYTNPYYAKEDVRGAVAEVRSGEHAGATVAVTGQITPAVGYYGWGELDFMELRDCTRASGSVPVARWSPQEKFATPDSVPSARFEEAPVLWLMAGRDWSHRWRECLEWLEETHEIVERAEFAGVDLFRLTQRVESGGEGRVRAEEAPAGAPLSPAHP